MVGDGAAGEGAGAGRRSLRGAPAQPHRRGQVRAEQPAGAGAGGGPRGAPCAASSLPAQRRPRRPAACQTRHVRARPRQCDRGVSRLPPRPRRVFRRDAHGRRHGGSQRMGASSCNVLVNFLTVARPGFLHPWCFFYNTFYWELRAL